MGPASERGADDRHPRGVGGHDPGGQRRPGLLGADRLPLQRRAQSGAVRDRRLRRRLRLQPEGAHAAWAEVAGGMDLPRRERQCRPGHQRGRRREPDNGHRAARPPFLDARRSGEPGLLARRREPAPLPMRTGPARHLPGSVRAVAEGPDLLRLGRRRGRRRGRLLLELRPVQVSGSADRGLSRRVPVCRRAPDDLRVRPELRTPPATTGRPSAPRFRRETRTTSTGVRAAPTRTARRTAPAGTVAQAPEHASPAPSTRRPTARPRSAPTSICRTRASSRRSGSAAS